MNPTSRASAQRRIGAALLAILGVAAALVSLWLWRAHGDDVAPLGNHSTSGEVHEPQAANAPSPVPMYASAADIVVQREAVGTARITGIVLDTGGEPLAGAHVTLQRRGSPPPKKQRLLLPREPGSNPFDGLSNSFYPVRSTSSDAGGTFAFDDVDAAEHTLSAALGAYTSQAITITGTEHRHVELRFPATETLLFGQIRGRRVGPGSIAVEVRHGHWPRMLQIESDGWYRGFVEAGPRTVRVKQHVPDVERRDTFVDVAERRIDVVAGTPRLRCDFDLGSARIDVVLEDPGSASTSDLQLVASGRCGLDGVEVEVTQPVVAAAATFDNLPFGVWHIGLRGPSAVVEATESVEVTAARPVAQVVMKVQRAGSLRVRARDLQGQNVPLAGAGLVLATSRGDRAGTDIGRTDRGRGVAEDFGFAGVPLGRAELVCEDRVHDGRHVFLPFDPQPRQGIDIVAGDQNRIELRVERRALVQLRAVDRVGREEREARVAVFAGEREVATTGTRPSMWRAHLPPGDYRIVVEQPSGRREHGLQVGRQNLEWKLRP